MYKGREDKVSKMLKLVVDVFNDREPSFFLPYAC